MLAEYGTILCSSTTIHENVVESLINNAKDGQDRPLPVVLILGSYHKRGFVEILDPSKSRDPSAFDKCYWLVYFSVQGFLKTIKDEKESEATKKIIEDTINRNSKDLKNKPRKKSVQTGITFFPAFESPDMVYQRPSFPLSPPIPEFPSQVEDIVNRSSQKSRRVYQDKIQHSLLYIPPTIGAISISRSIQNTSLTPPQVCVEVEVIPDTLNYPQPLQTYREHNAHCPVVTYPIPPLIYIFDVRTEFLPCSPAPEPDIERGDDCVNMPQPVILRQYFNDQDSQCVIMQEIMRCHHIQDPQHDQSHPTFHLSAPGSPNLLRHDQDIVNKTSKISPHQSLYHYISPPVFFPPVDNISYKSLQLEIELQPPQQALYILVDDSYLLNTLSIKCVSNAHILSSILCKTPTIPPDKNVNYSSYTVVCLSPPQSPMMPMRRESKVEDLFDQVRKHSRGLNFYR